MLLVKTYLDKSKIHGIGLFAGKNIKKNTKIAEYNPFFHNIVYQIDYKKLPKLAKSFVKKYGVKKPLYYLLYLDDERFMNHKNKPNTKQLGAFCCIAIKDIRKGEEITCNYKEL